MTIADRGSAGRRKRSTHRRIRREIEEVVQNEKVGAPIVFWTIRTLFVWLPAKTQGAVAVPRVRDCFDADQANPRMSSQNGQNLALPPSLLR